MTFFFMFCCFDNNWHKGHRKLNNCEFTKINLKHLYFLTLYVIRKITNRINMFICYINYFKYNKILISFFWDLYEKQLIFFFFLRETIDMKYGIFTQIQLFLQQLKQCPIKKKK